jgi:hypothetical protein
MANALCPTHAAADEADEATTLNEMLGTARW